MQARWDLVDSGGAGGQLAQRRNRDARERIVVGISRTVIREELRVRHNVSLIVDPVEPLGVQYIRDAEAIVKISRSCPDHGLRRPETSLAAAQAPGDADAGRPVPVVADILLNFI